MGKRNIEKEYQTESIEKIYLQSDSGGWMKKGLEVLGAEAVLDGFHLSEYIRRMVRLCVKTEEDRQDERKSLEEWIAEGKRKELERWVEEKGAELGEQERKKLQEDWRYLKNNWKGIRRRVNGSDGVTGSSTEGHVSHVLSARMSSRPMGWSREGANRLSRLRIYWVNGGDMTELVQGRKEPGKEAAPEGECCLSAAKLLSWERQHHRADGKYIEALRARVSRQTSVKVHFNAAIAGLF